MTGTRIGEALGLRREDMHFLPDSRLLGCKVKGPHVHVGRRVNSNNAFATSVDPRWIPVDEVTVGLSTEYRFARDAVPHARLAGLSPVPRPANLARSRVLPARGAANSPRHALLLLRLPGAEQVEQP